jgi:cupin 2 domain-containing protein
MPTPENLLGDLPATSEEEHFIALLERPGVRIERIVSTGQATPPGEWLSQAHEEWVLLLKGAAALTLKGEPSLTLGPGDHVLIGAGRRHRVDWTDPHGATVWLAVHIG